MAVVAELLGQRGELVLGRSVANALGPQPQPPAQLGEVPRDVLEDAEMRQRQPLRRPPISSIVWSQASRSMSGGGVGGSTNAPARS